MGDLLKVIGGGQGGSKILLSIFYTMAGPLANNPLEKWLGVIRRGTYQAASEDSRWAYEPLSDIWPDIYPASDSSNDGSSD